MPDEASLLLFCFGLTTRPTFRPVSLSEPRGPGRRSQPLQTPPPERRSSLFLCPRPETVDRQKRTGPPNATPRLLSVHDRRSKWGIRSRRGDLTRPKLDRHRVDGGPSEREGLRRIAPRERMPCTCPLAPRGIVCPTSHHGRDDGLRAASRSSVVRQRSGSAAGRGADRPLQPVVCAQHGRVANGVQVPCRRTARENVKELLPKANLGRVTNRGEEG